jgi:hypothetical protein
MRPRLFLACLLLLAPLAAPGLAVAQPPPGGQPLDRLLPEIRRAYPGQFLDAEGVTTGGNPHYPLKWLTPDGRVMWLDADARTGRVQRTAPGRDSFDAPRYRGGGEEMRAPDRGPEGRDYGGGARFDRGRSYSGGDDAPPPRSRFGNGNFGGGGFGNRNFENRGGPQRGFGGNRSGRDFGGAPRGRGGNRR